MLEIMAWKESEALFGLAQFIAATRPGYDVAPFAGTDGVEVMEIPALAISSTDVRRRVHDGRPIRFLGARRESRTHIRTAEGLYR